MKRYWLGGKDPKAQDKFFVEALDPGRWQAGSKDDWDTCWFTGMPDADLFEHLKSGNSINHIPGNNGVTVKSLLYKTLSAQRNRVAGHDIQQKFDFFPRVYSMPGEYFDFQRDAAANPDKLWIAKPKSLSRGRGLGLVTDPGTVAKTSDWLVQRYIDNPHLYDGHKYVLRCYVLITSVEPLRVYLYKEGFAKLASEKYAKEDLSNPYVHLTNPDINELNEEVETPVIFIPFSDYKTWLTAQGMDPNEIFAKIKDLVVLTAISVRERMRERLSEIASDTSGCYELIGIDCLVDETGKPWILECNLSPSLEVVSSSGGGDDVEASVKRNVVEDIVSIKGLNEDNPPWLNTQGAQRIVAQHDFEQDRSGKYELVFPSQDVDNYLPAFPIPRYADRLLAEHMLGKPLREPTYSIGRVTEFYLEDGLVLHDATSGDMLVPNPTASWIWLNMGNGRTTNQITQDLIERKLQADETSENEKALTRQIEGEVWDALADWGHKGLLGHFDSASAPNRSETWFPKKWHTEHKIDLLGNSVAWRSTCPAASARMTVFGEAKETDDAPSLIIEILEGRQGYAIITRSSESDIPKLTATDVKLSRIAPIVSASLVQFICDQNERNSVLRGCLLETAPGKGIFVTATGGGAWDTLALRLSQHEKFKLMGGAALATQDLGKLIPIPIPARSPIQLADAPSQDNLIAASSASEWTRAESGFLFPCESQAALEAIDIQVVLVPEDKHGQTKAEMAALSEADTIANVWPCRLGSADPDIVSAAVDQLANMQCFRITFSYEQCNTTDLAKLVHNALSKKNV